MLEECKIENLYNLNKTIAKPLLERFIYPWEVLDFVEDFIIELGKSLNLETYELKGDNIWIAKTAKIMKTAYIEGPTIIGENSEVRHCAFIRKNAIIGNNCVVRKFNRTKKCNFI